MDPTFRKPRAFDRIHVRDEPEQGERLLRGEPGVEGLEGEEPSQSLVVEPSCDLAVERAEASHARQRHERTDRSGQIERRVVVAVDEGRHLDLVELAQPRAELTERIGIVGTAVLADLLRHALGVGVHAQRLFRLLPLGIEASVLE